MERRTLAATTLAAVLVLLGASPARSETLVDPQFDARFAEFKKILRVTAEDPQPDAKAAKTVVTTFAGTRDTRVVKELFSGLSKSQKAVTEAKVALDEVSERHRQVMETYFAWWMQEYKRTGKKPTVILVVHKEALEDLDKKLKAAAAHFDLRSQIDDALKAGLTAHLAAMGDQRALALKDLIGRGSRAKEPGDRAAFAAALGTVGGPEAEAALLEMEVTENKESEPLIAVIEALASIGSQAGFDKIRQRAFDARWPVAAAALQALRKSRHKETVPTLVEFVSSAKDERLTLDAYEILFDVTGKHFADDPAPWKSWWTAEGEMFLKRWDASTAVTKQENEPNANSDPKQSDVAAELAALLPTEPEPDVRREILANLSIHRSYHARVTLLRALRDERRDIRLAAVRGLANMHHLSVPEALMKLVDDADEEVLAAIFQSLRTLWGGEDEFGVTRVDKEELRRWWENNKDRVVDQFLMLGARDIASGKPPRTEEPESSQSRTFYGMHVRSSRVLFCVDFSLSMDEPYKKDEQKKKIEVAKEELQRVIKSLPDGGTFGLITFAAYPTLYETGMMPLTKKSRERAVEWVKALPTGPGTNIYDTLEMAFQVGVQKSQFKASDAPDTIYLVSDGDPTQGKFLEPGPILDFVRRTNAHRRVEIHAIGVGVGHNVDFLRALTEQNGGVYAAR